MKEPINTKNVANRQQNSTEWLQELHSLPRFALGLFVSAVFAWYLPQLLVTLTTGAWYGFWKMWLVNGIVVSVLATINLIANKLNRVLLTGWICAVIIECYEVLSIVRTETLEDWRVWMPRMLVGPAVFRSMLTYSTAINARLG